MTVERTIPVYLGGPAHGRPIPPREELLAELFVYPPAPEEYGLEPVRQAPVAEARELEALEEAAS